jgi:hypothetical protein
MLSTILQALASFLQRCLHLAPKSSARLLLLVAKHCLSSLLQAITEILPELGRQFLLPIGNGL